MAGVPLGFARFRPWYAALRTGAAFNPVALPDLLVYYDIRRTDTLFQDTAGVTPVTAATDPIGRWDAVGPSGAPNLTQGTAPSRPPYQLTPTRAAFDLLDDSLSVTLPAISGGQIVIVSPTGIWIDSLTFAGGTFTIGPSGYTGGPDGLLSLLSGDVTAVYILDETLSVDDQAALVAFEAARGSAGLITLGGQLVANPGGPFTSASGYSVSGSAMATLSVVGGAIRATAAVGGTIRVHAPVATINNKKYLLSVAGNTISSLHLTNNSSGTIVGSVGNAGADGSAILTANQDGMWISLVSPGAITAGLSIEMTMASLREVILP